MAKKKCNDRKKKNIIASLLQEHEIKSAFKDAFDMPFAFHYIINQGYESQNLAFIPH